MDIYDGSWKLISYDPETGRTIWYLSDNQWDVYRIDYPVSQILDLNQACAVSAGEKRGDWQRIASVPLSVLRSSHLLQAHSEGDDQWVSKWLNNRDNASWRTSEGCV